MKNRGFTMVNLIILIGVLLVLAASTFYLLNPARRIGKANDARRLTDVHALVDALELYTIDNAQVPTDFSTSTISVGQKFVLCSASSALSCAGTSAGCLVIDDADFLGKYLEELPVDPLKTSTADTGYYITRKVNNVIAFGACTVYDDVIEIVAKAAFPTLSAVCGNGFTDAGEICDDGNTTTETSTCGNGTTESGTYCNSDCTATVVLDEACDDGNASTEYCGDSVAQNGSYCDNDCDTVLNLSETCDDGADSDGCGDGDLDMFSRIYCNASCDGYYETVSEVCDSNFTGGCPDADGHDYYSGGYVHNNGSCKNYTICRDDCTECKNSCVAPP